MRNSSVADMKNMLQAPGRPRTSGQRTRRLAIACAALAVLVSACGGPMRRTATPASYSAERGWAKLDRAWGSTSAVDVDRNGNVWVFERCGANTCADSTLAPVLEFDSSGRLVRGAADARGNLYGAEVALKNVTRYVRQ